MIYGAQTHCVNVWEAISAHACKSKTNSIRRPSACSDCRMHGTWKRDRDEYIVFAGSSGIWGRDCYPRGLRTGVAFYLAAVLLGLLVTPNKFYVITFAAMGFYILGIEAVWMFLAKRPQMGHRMGFFWFAKYLIFNLVYLPCLFGFRSMLFQKVVSDQLLLAAVMVGQIAILVYDKAYQYVQGTLWEKWRKRVL